VQTRRLAAFFDTFTGFVEHTGPRAKPCAFKRFLRKSPKAAGRQRIVYFVTTINVYFVFGYACIMCICRKTAIWLFLDCFGTQSGFFWWKEVGNPGGQL